MPVLFGCRDGRAPFSFHSAPGVFAITGETVSPRSGDPRVLSVLLWMDPFPQPASSVPLHIQITLGGTVLVSADQLHPDPRIAANFPAITSLGLTTGVRVPAGSSGSLTLVYSLPDDVRTFLGTVAP